MKAVIDTNVLIYDTLEDSVFHEEARGLLERLEEWLIPLIVVYEYIWFMKGLNVSVGDALAKTEEYLLLSRERSSSRGRGTSLTR